MKHSRSQLNQFPRVSLKFLFFFLLILHSTFSILHSTLLEVSPDGSQPYTTIQSAIDASANGDTVLVHPGRYIENVDFLGKSITLGSLELTTNDSTFVSQTIIDGNQNGSCIKIIGCEIANIRGLTLTNGSGTYDNNYRVYEGGGIYARNSSLLIESNIIHNNRTDKGGGFLAEHCVNLLLSGNKIFNNFAKLRGGGASIAFISGQVEFDSIFLNDIQLNFAGIRGNDLVFVRIDQVDIYLGKYTYTEYTEESVFVVTTYEQTPVWTFSFQEGLIEPINQDLYVSPEGDDNNSGLTPDDPLKTIACANMLIASDSLNPKTIHLSNGIYSGSQNDQFFPINMKPYVRFEGESEENTIIDAEEIDGLIFAAWRAEKEVGVKNITFQNTRVVSGLQRAVISAMYTGDFQDGIDVNYREPTVYLENITIREHETKEGFILSAMIDILQPSYLSMKNITATDSRCGVAISIAKGRSYLENIRINNISPLGDTSTIDNDNEGIALIFNCYLNDYSLYETETIVKNLEIVNNTTSLSDWYYSHTILVGTNNNVYLINSTIADNACYNHQSYSGAVSANGRMGENENTQLHIVNSIIHGNTPRQLHVGASILKIENSCIQDGQQQIYSYNNAEINWLEGNITANPLFLGEGDYPYSLSANSPCIDAGTLNLPEGVELPEYDLAGNPRVVNGAIDMGAYEYQGTQTSELEIENVKFKINIYPNPVNLSEINSRTCHIWFEIPKEGKAEIAIYNIKGQKVKNIFSGFMTPGKQFLRWNGTDEHNKPVASGNYLLSLKQGSVIRVKKMVVVK
ncbi:MAG: choice-of-anchor Q domain-containing protein [Candidatus Cloacimonetes bacterium]|nr:choice-of-anchor Q domain-containing protein [Candidatus Cloacimonadota bacterium]